MMHRRLDNARNASLAWLGTMRRADGSHLFSATHDPRTWPGMLLPGTYDAIHCRVLISGMPPLGAAIWLRNRRMPDGRFRLSRMTDAAILQRPDLEAGWNYIDLHTTGLAVSAMLAAGERNTVLSFLDPYLNLDTLSDWLARRDWTDPRREGNALTDLAGFLLLADAQGEGRARPALVLLVAHLEVLQSPETGFWGLADPAGGAQTPDPAQSTNPPQDTGPIHNTRPARPQDMAGAARLYHLWYRLGRPVPHQTRAIDFALTLDPSDNPGASLDLDTTDLLAHGLRLTDHRSDEIRAWLEVKLSTLLDGQRADGGFADRTEGVLRFEGWIRGYAELQGRSNTYATWYRWAAIALIARELYPKAHDWRFRSMIGIGSAHGPRSVPPPA